MTDVPMDTDDIPDEIDFSKGVRGLHHIPPAAKLFVPPLSSAGYGNTSPEKAEQRGVELAELLSEVLRHDIEITAALK